MSRQLKNQDIPMALDEEDTMDADMGAQRLTPMPPPLAPPPQRPAKPPLQHHQSTKQKRRSLGDEAKAYQGSDVTPLGATQAPRRTPLLKTPKLARYVCRDVRWFRLGGDRYVQVKMYKAWLYVNIRQFYTDRTTGKLTATRNGISLTKDQWEQFALVFDDVQLAVREIAERYASVSGPA